MRNQASLDISGFSALDVRDFTVVSTMSDLFQVEITAVSGDLEIDPDALLGQAAELSLQFGRSLRVQGLVVGFDLLRVDEEGLATYGIVLAPRAHLLSERKNYRVFQFKSELEIAEQLLSEWQVPLRVRADRGSHPPRKFRVQYGETDYDFMRRMLEDAGISFYFDFSEETQLVLDDEPTSQELRHPAVAFSDTPGVSDADYVTKVVVRQRTRPGAMLIGDLDYRRPSTQQPRLGAKGGLGQESALEVFEYTPGAFLYGGATAGGSSPTSDDRGVARTNELVGQSKTQKHLGAYRSDAKKITFETSIADLCPGASLTISGHPGGLLQLDDGLLVVRTVLMGGHDDDWNVFAESVPTSQPHRPAKITPKPIIRGLESATVVGPASEDIHTDEYARVRVHFHWDRESARDEQSSCWIPTNQPWAGAGFGGTVLPRVGQEVLVSFLGGDPDRPVVLGRVYTEHQPPPYPLPAGKTITGLVGRSTPHFVSGSSEALPPHQIFILQGAGPNYAFRAVPPQAFGRQATNNAFLLEDAAGGNLVFLQAERDLNILAKNSWKTVVGNYRGTFVENADVLEVRNKQDINVGVDQRLAVHGNQSITVGNERTEELLNDQGTIVEGNARVHSEGVINHQADKHIVLEAGQTIEFRVGDSHITMDGREITIQSARVNINDAGVCYGR